MHQRRAQAFHAVTALVAAVALVLQLVLVVEGGRVLDDVTAPGLAVRLARFVAYFTIQSTSSSPSRRPPSRGGRTGTAAGGGSRAWPPSSASS